MSARNPKFADSPLEQRRFELSVPPPNASVPRGATWVLRTAPGFGVALLRSAILVRGVGRGDAFVLWAFECSQADRGELLTGMR
jgi:hypothetical protein